VSRPLLPDPAQTPERRLRDRPVDDRGLRGRWKRRRYPADEGSGRPSPRKNDRRTHPDMPSSMPAAAGKGGGCRSSDTGGHQHDRERCVTALRLHDCAPSRIALPEHRSRNHARPTPQGTHAAGGLHSHAAACPQRPMGGICLRGTGAHVSGANGVLKPSKIQADSTLAAARKRVRAKRCQ
jgi:hypothetical protein